MENECLSRCFISFPRKSLRHGDMVRQVKKTYFTLDNMHFIIVKCISYAETLYIKIKTELLCCQS